MQIHENCYAAYRLFPVIYFEAFRSFSFWCLWAKMNINLKELMHTYRGKLYPLTEYCFQILTWNFIAIFFLSLVLIPAEKKFYCQSINKQICFGAAVCSSKEQQNFRGKIKNLQFVQGRKKCSENSANIFFFVFLMNENCNSPQS